MEQIKRAILAGLKQHGREQTFSQILEAAGYKLDPSRRMELAAALESAGLIKNVSYQLPVAIRAELTDAGKKFLLSDNTPPQQSGTSAGLTGILIFLQLNLAFLYKLQGLDLLYL